MKMISDTLFRTVSSSKPAGSKHHGRSFNIDPQASG